MLRCALADETVLPPTDADPSPHAARPVSPAESSQGESVQLAVWLPCWLLFVGRVVQTVVERRAFDSRATLVLLAAIAATVHLARTVRRWRAARARPRPADRGVDR